MSAALARAHFEAYRTGDRAAAEAIVAPDFRFTSPQDEQIGREAFFERCFPTADRFSSQELVHLVEVGDDVLLTYDYVLASTGDRHRNAEVLTFAGGRLVEVQVFFGGRYPG